MGLRYKLLGLFLLQLFSVGILIVEEEYLMFVCVVLLVFIASVVVVDLLKDWLDSRRLEILVESKRLNKKLLVSLEKLLEANKSKQLVKSELSKLMLLERKKKLQSKIDLETLYINKKKGNLLKNLRGLI